MIKPVNGHLVIEPVVHEAFIASQRETYQEIGIVVAVASFPPTYTGDIVHVGDKVYFDAWLAAKFPREKDGEFYWLVKCEDVRAVENVEPK